METRANYFWVGVVTLLLLVALMFFIVWLAGANAGSRKPYDILFRQSVSGLARGSQVNFSGVPVGEVTQIQLWGGAPNAVRVRIEVEDDVPILVGATATLQSSFTGTSSLLLEGARAGAPPITCETTACPDGVPVIPTKTSGLGELIANAPLLLERVATVTERLNQVLSDENLEQFSSALRNTNRLTGELANAVPEVRQTAPEINRTLQSMQVTLGEADAALRSFQTVMNSADNLVNGEGLKAAQDVRQTIKKTNEAVEKLSKLLDTADPVAQRLGSETIPEAEAALRDLQKTTKSLRAITDQLSSQGATSLIGSQKLPDYEP